MENRFKQFKSWNICGREGVVFTHSSPPSSFQYTSKRAGITGTIPDKVKQRKTTISSKEREILSEAKWYETKTICLVQLSS